MQQNREDRNTSKDLKTQVLLCASLEKVGSGLDLQEIHRWLDEVVPAVEVRAVPELCNKPGEMGKAVADSGAQRLVLGLCSQVYSEIELQAQARRVGLDPFGMEVVKLGTYCARVHPRLEATEKAKLLLEAAVARARAFCGSRPDSLKPVFSWDQAVSRRALFTLPPLHYEAVPSILEELCAAGEGCRICAEMCPHKALSPTDDSRMVLNKSACTGCAACVSTCPRSAMDIPGTSPGQIDAQVTALLKDQPPSSRGLLFLCERGATVLEGLAQKGFSYPAGWRPVEVPCIGMVTPAWLLQALNMGAGAVAVLPCGSGDCRFGQPEIIRGRIEYTREVLNLVGGSAESVRLLDPTHETELVRSLSLLPQEDSGNQGELPHGTSFFSLRSTAKAILGFGEKYGASLDRSLDHPHSPLGDIELSDGCTACGACASTCPTGALAMERNQDNVDLTFDAQICVGCGECVPVCPEKVIAVKRATNLRRVSQGRIVMHRTSEVRCEKCGDPVAPNEMLTKIAALLGNDPTITVVTKYCLSCRGTLFPKHSTAQPEGAFNRD